MINGANTSKSVILFTKFQVFSHFTLFWYFLESNLLRDKF